MKKKIKGCLNAPLVLLGILLWFWALRKSDSGELG